MPKKKTEKRKLKDKLEKIVKQIVKIRDNYTCQKCGKKVEGVNCHASHVIPVSRDGRLAYDVRNMKVMCYHCHINWFHKHPVEAGRWFTEKFPHRWTYLEHKYNNNSKGGSIPLWWYEERIEYYTELLKRIS